MIYVLHFLIWTLSLYVIHRVAHAWEPMRMLHLDHHRYVAHHSTGWHWSNLCLFNDTWKSTGDLWITEVIPTIALSIVFGHWYFLVAYYLWAAFLQEELEHNKSFNMPILTAGRWHLVHHSKTKFNYGLFIPLWDIVFRTEQKPPAG